MERLEVKLVIDCTTYINEWYIKVDQDGSESIWKKSTKVKDGQEEILQNMFYIDGSHRSDLKDPEEVHKFLVNFLHGIEECERDDIDPDDSFETIITFHDDSDPVYEVYEDNMEDLRRKVKAIQKKCARYGCDFHYEECGEVIREVTDPDGQKILCKFVKVKASGTAKINNWSFVASVEHTDAGNIFTKALTDLEIPVRYRTAPCTCEHCKTNRIRKDTFIVYNNETKEFKQVGKSCLKDFTGGLSAQTAVWFASLKDIFEEAQTRPAESYITRYFDPVEILQFTAETIRYYGYTKGDYETVSTKDRMETFFNYFHGFTKFWDQKYLDQVRSTVEQTGFNHKSPEAVQMTKDALAWIAGQEATNDYMHNLKTVCSLEAVQDQHFGLLVSLFPTYNRDLERQERQKKERQSKHVGQIGDRIDIKVDSCRCVTSWETMYGVTYLYKITDTEGNIFIWKTSKCINDDIKGLKGTVKDHSEFRDTKQTDLTRCKVIA